MGDSKSAEVRVRWPGEGWSKPYAVEAGQFAVLDKTSAAAVAWQPPR